MVFVVVVEDLRWRGLVVVVVVMVVERFGEAEVRWGLVVLDGD